MKTPRSTRIDNANTREGLAALLPHRSGWMLPDGAVVKLAAEDGTACSHGIYAKEWVASRFAKRGTEGGVARRMQERAEELLVEFPRLAGEPVEGGCLLYEDVAHKQAALEDGWVRIKALHSPNDTELTIEVYREADSLAAIEVITEVAASLGYRVRLLQGGPLSRVGLPNSDEGAQAPGTEPPTSVIVPNRSLWLMPDGRVVDVAYEGTTEDGAAYSHGIYVKKWVGFRLDNFCPDKAEQALAQQIRTRAKELLRQHPDLESDLTEDGTPNPFSGDLAYNHAAEELGWIRVRPLTRPTEAIYAETIDGEITSAALQVLAEAVQRCNCPLRVLTGGPLANRAKDIQHRYNKAIP